MAGRKATEKELRQAIGDVLCRDAQRDGPEALPELQRRYKTTGNPLYCWKAITALYGTALPYPSWVEDYLLGVSLELGSGKSGNAALEITDKHLRMRHTRDNVEMAGVMIEAMLQVQGLSRTNQHIRDVIMDKFEIEEETVKQWWGKYRKDKHR